VKATLTTRMVPLEEWDEVVESFDCRTVYHSAAWIRTLCKEFGLTPHLLACQDPSGTTRLAWPGLVVRKGPLQILGSPLPGWSTPYMGPLAVSPAALAEALKGSDLNHRLRRFSYIEFRALRECSSDESFVQMGFLRQSEFETYLLDVASPSEEELWDQLASTCRNRIRKARKSKLSVEFETDASFIDEFWEMSLNVFRKWGLRPQFPKTLLSRMWDELADGGIKVLTARRDGQRIAMLLLLIDHRSMYYLAGGSLPEFNRFAPNNLLHWEAILEAKRLGLRTYDFVSASGTAGKFKKTFGPRKVVMSTCWSRSRTPAEELFKQTYEKYIRWKLGAKR
jgi:hypothetical protein